MDALAVQVGHYPTYDLTAIGKAGFNCVKFVCMQDRDGWKLAEYIDDVHAHGLKAWGIVARESVDSFLTITAAAEHYGNDGDGLDYAVVLNEADGKSDENPMSWCLPVSEAARVLRIFRAAFRGRTKLYAIGTVRGDGGWVKQLLANHPAALNGYDALDVHAYAQDSGSVGNMLDNYQVGLPLVCGEYGTPDPDPAQRGRHARDLARAMDVYGMQAAAVYCWAQEQGEGMFVNHPKALPFIRELGYKPGGAPMPPTPLPHFEFTLGMKAEAQRLATIGVDVGEPLMAERYPWDNADFSWQRTTKGKFEYDKIAHTCHFYPAAGT